MCRGMSGLAFGSKIVSFDLNKAVSNGMTLEKIEEVINSIKRNRTLLPEEERICNDALRQLREFERHDDS